MERFFGEVIRGARQRRGWTMGKLATDIGRAEGEISNWEGGARPVPERVLLLIARTLGLTIAGLFAEHFAALADWQSGCAAYAIGTLGVDPGAGFLGDAVRGARERSGLTQRSLGAACRPPMSQAAISAMELGVESRTRAGEMKSREEPAIERVAQAMGLKLSAMVAAELERRGLIRRVAACAS